MTDLKTIKNWNVEDSGVKGNLISKRLFMDKEDLENVNLNSNIKINKGKDLEDEFDID